MKALEKDRTRRYETASSLGSTWNIICATRQFSPAPPAPVIVSKSLFAGTSWLCRCRLAISLALVLGLGISTWLFLKERDAHRRAVAAEQAERALRQKAQVSELNARALQYWNEGKLAEAEGAASVAGAVAESAGH